jgi:hypothetical protein
MFHGRVLGPQLVAVASRHKVRLLFGARQTGKTALLRYLLSDERTWPRPSTWRSSAQVSRTHLGR